MAVAAPADRIGEILIRDGLINRQQLDKALEDARASGHRVGFSLVKLGLIGEQELAITLARQHRVSAVDLERAIADPRRGFRRCPRPRYRSRRRHPI